MDKFAYLKYAENKENININSKIINILPKYFKDKYIIKKNPFVINDIQYLDLDGYEIIFPILKEEENSIKYEIIFEKTIFELEKMNISAIASDVKVLDIENDIIFMDGKNLKLFFVFESIKKVLKFVKKDLKYAEILIIDGNNENTYNVIDKIYEDVNYLTIFTARPDYFTQYSEQIYSDTGLNLQITDQNKSALKNADIIINLYNECDFNFDYFYKKGAVYFELTKNSQKSLEMARKRQDINIIDDIAISYDSKLIKNNILESILYIKDENFRNFINHNNFAGKKHNNIMKNSKLNIIGFYQYGNFINQYKS